MLFDILAIPIEFIKENLTGWTILILVIIIIYFVGLRNYYLRKELFYDQSIAEKNMKDIEDVETDILEEENNKIQPTRTTKPANPTNAIKATKATKNTKPTKSNDKKHNTNKDNTKDNTITNKKKNNIAKQDSVEAFEDNIANQYSPPLATNNAINNAINNANKSVTIQKPQDTISSYVSTTMFDNLNLNSAQIQSCKLKYNDIIAQYIIDLGKLAKLQSTNRYLNTQKQFDLIIAKGIDNIINYLNNTIKSYNVLTRTSIRTEVINTLDNVIDLLIDKTNTDFSNQMNTLARLNSTTIDYSTQLTSINELRALLEEYIGINNLLSEYSRKVNNKNKEVSSILDKSFILPIYERNFDKIKQLVNSDFNNDENNLADKYSKAYMEFMEEKKKEDLGVNPLRLASQIESGLVSLLTGVASSKNTNSKQRIGTPHIATPRIDNANSLIEQYGFTENNVNYLKNNPIPEQESKLLNSVTLSDSNIVRDPGNRGSYLIDKKTQKDILEGFAEDTPTTTSEQKETPTITNTTSPNLVKAINNSNNNKKKKNNNNDIISNLLSTNFLQYIMDVISEKLNIYMQYYNSKMGNSSKENNNNNSNSTSNSDNDSDNSKFKFEDNMIPAGFLLFILSMLIYFIDITSTS